ncbi:unnamed protein product [Paramecium sonneborni]|uniref:Regulator of chromosome condensation 1/beta-lactamase-inhibitor protein II n=1 Tax=Paramecium sonneborni TaxID=65129 RepID=A0A8S1R836_9CILI|nr:unnamed protein product [Paramecium sonneborni]
MQKKDQINEGSQQDKRRQFQQDKFYRYNICKVLNNNKEMTHVLYFGKTLANLQTESLGSQQQILTRVCLPENVFSNDQTKQNKGGEQQVGFVKVICKENMVFLIDHKCELWAFGGSNEGQLGLRIAGLVYPVNLSQVMDTKIKYVTASQNFVSVYTMKNRLYIWGKMEELNLGECQKQKRVEFSKTIDRRYEFQCYEISTIIQGNQGKNELQQLESSGNKLYLLTQDCLFLISNKIVQIRQNFVGLACNQNHVLAWDIEGRVWSWGSQSDGKLGYMNFEQQEQIQPKLVENLKNRIIQCACGLNYSLALDVKGDIYGWGKGPFKIELLKATQPTKLIDKNKSFVKVIAGEEHFGALDMVGQLFVWGLNHNNCLGQMDEEVQRPTLFELSGLKIIDASMGPTCTVLIVPSGRLQKLPNLNLDTFTNQQKKCFIEEASLIRDFTERRNRQTLMQMLTPTQSKQHISDDKEYDKANQLIHLMQLKLDSPRIKQTFNSTHFSNSIFSNNELSNRTMRSPISFDNVQNKLNKLENNNPLYLPILPRFQMTSNTNEDEINLDFLIQTDDDELKYRYIQLVKDNSEDQVLMQLLDEQTNKKTHSFQTPRHQLTKIKLQSEPKIIKFNDKYDKLDPNLLENVKKELAEISKERWKQYLKKRKIRQNKINMLKTKFQMTKLEQMSKEEQIESNRLQAVEKNVKIQYTILRKEERLKTKLEGLQQQLHENSTEFQIKKKTEMKKEVAKFFAFLLLLQYLDFEASCQMFEEAAFRGLQKKRLLFQANNKAKIIQKAVRRRNIIKMINNNLGEKPKKILLSFIFRIRMSIRIKKRRLLFRKLNLFYQRNQLFLKVRMSLNIMMKSTKNIQTFCKFYNQTIKTQLSYLNYKWDEYLKQEFKGLVIDKDKEEQKINQLQFLNEKQIQIMKQLSYPYKTNKQLLREMQLQKKPKFKTDILRINIIKKIQNFQPQEDEPKDREIRTSFNNVLLPYTKYVDNIIIPQNFRIRFDYQEIQLLNVLDKVNQEEAKLKLELLQTYQRIQRKDYIQQCRNYFQALCEFKQKNKVLIGTERMKMMSKLSSDEIKQLKLKDEIEYRSLVQKRDINMKRFRMFDSGFKENIFEKIKVFQQDNYPFQLLTYKLVIAQSKIEPPKLTMELSYKEWVRLFKNYHTDFKIRLQSIMSEARRAAAYKAKQIKRSTTIKSKSIQSKKAIDIV